MLLRHILTHILAIAIICASLPPAVPAAYAAHVNPASPSSPAAVKPQFALRSNMRIAAPPQLAEFPGACTPRETGVATPDTTNQVWLPLVLNSSAAVATTYAADAAEVDQPTLIQLPAIPLDPRLLATPLDEGTSFAESIAFLYSGPNAVQTGVAAGAIDPGQAAVLRGTVRAQDGQPLPGVKIQIFGHTDYGQTISRADGAYDMVVNAAQVTVCFEVPGHLPTQRMVNAAWHDFTTLADVVLLPMDDVVSTIDLANSSAIQVAQNRPTSDADGDRQSTLLFEAGTGAQMVMADGSTKPLSTLNVRATEYTVGANGPQAMPGELPLASGYTYAVDFTVDEALTAGAVDVQFDKPIINYVENFLDFPVGTAVPTGYYDRGRGAWTPSQNGRVIRVLSVNGGAALLDVDGSGQAASADKLAELGIDAAEQRTIAELYSAGQSLWRVPIPHFTPWDHNWPYGPPPDAGPPPPPAPPGPSPDEPNCERGGSIIECETRELGEQVDIAGTPFSLNYRSGRTLGYQSAVLDIPLTLDAAPPSVSRIETEISVAGRQFKETHGVQPNQFMRFQWDGRDAYDRPLSGSQPIRIRVGYVYPATYRQPGSDFNNAFGNFGDAVFAANRARQEITIWREVTTRINAPFDGRQLNLGGWMLNAHHYLDITNGSLLRGDGGENLSPQPTINTVLGNGSGCVLYDADTNPTGCGYNGPMDQVTLGGITEIALGPDGNIYFADVSNALIARVERSGLVSVIAGGRRCLAYETPNCGRGGPAIEAGFTNIWDMDIGPDGSIYIVDYGSLRRIGPDGRITTVMERRLPGEANIDDWGNGGPALAAQLQPNTAAVGPDGSVYVLASVGKDFNGTRQLLPSIFRIDGAGNMSRIGGLQTPHAAIEVPDGTPIAEANLSPTNIMVSPTGELYILHAIGSVLYRLDSAGILHQVAGYSFTGCIELCNVEGQPATKLRLTRLVDMKFGPDGSIYLLNLARLYRILPNGTFTIVAGTGFSGFGGDGGPPREAQFIAHSVAILPDGSLMLADGGNGRLRQITSLFNRTSFVPNPARAAAEAELFFQSRDGREIYVFDLTGRHLRTHNARTGAVTLTFGYDNAQRLITLTNYDGKVTTIERDGSGAPTAIVGPFGQRTQLALNGDGYLAAITNPAGATHRMTYHNSDGLLATFTDPNGNRSQLSYTDLGYLRTDEFATGGSWQLDQLVSAAGYSVTLTSALGRTTTFAVNNQSGGGTRTATFPNGASNQVQKRPDGTYETTYADGTVMTSRFDTDPRADRSAPMLREVTVRLPTGQQTRTTVDREQLVDNIFEPLSPVNWLTTTTTINDATFTSSYSGATQTQRDVSAAGRQASTRFDAIGRVIEQGGFGLAPVAYQRNGQGQLTSMTIGVGADARVYTIEYDGQGELKALINPLNQRNEIVVNSAGQIASHTRPDGAVSAFVYDANGNMTSLTPPGQPAHTFTYNGANQLTAYSAPDVGSGSSTTSYSYNADGQLTTLTRPDGAVVTVRYDAAGRPQSVALGRGALQYGYDATTGQLNSITAPDGGTLTYKHSGPLLTESQWTGAVAGTVQRAYDNFRRVNRLTVNGVPIAYTHDADGMVTQAGALALMYDANGLPSGSTLNHMVTSTAFNPFGELSNGRATYGGNALYEATYTRDHLGRITHKVETIGGVSTVYDYAYSNIGRLREVQQNGAVIAAYSYDANGNRLSGPGGATGTYDAQDRLLRYGAATYSYNAAGDLTSKNVNGQSTTYVYDEVGNLTSVTLSDGRVISYVIDGNNRRIGKSIDGAPVQGFLYQDQLRIVAELDGSNNVVSRFVYADSSNVPAYMVRGGVTYGLISDHLGSVRLVVNADTGAVVQRLDYDAFGVVLTDTNPGFQPFGFAGGLYDADSGLTRFGRRDYDAETGRWTTKDPLGFAGGDTNLYLYVGGDPVNLKDQGGNFFFTAIVLSAILLASIMALPLAMKVLKKWQERRNQQPADEFVGPPLPPQVCQQAPPPEPLPAPAPAPAPAPEPEPDPLPEEAPPAAPEPEPPVIDDRPDYMWANSEAPPPCPSPLIQPPLRGKLCK
ncbi:MAG: hypothetical protein H6645_05105 [Caldilineaceae bacterium]|nr:hypothetical protein [Caldilineaceae bacterium]